MIMEEEKSKAQQEAEEKAKRFIPRSIRSQRDETELLRRDQIQKETLQKIKDLYGWDQ